MLDPLSIEIPLGTPTATQSMMRPPRKLLRPSPDHPDDYILELDYSSISKFLECPRMAENYLIHGREAQREPVAMNFGKLFHRAEEMRLRNGFSIETSQAQQAAVEDHFLLQPVPPDEYRTGDRMLDVLRKYQGIYKDDDWNKKVLVVDGESFVERPFKIELCSVDVNGQLPFDASLLLPKREDDYLHQPLFVRSLHILYIGKIDAVIQDSNSLWVLDHKTSSRGGREFEEAFRLSLQTRGYVWAAQKILGREVMGLIMNAVIVRPLTKTGTGTEFNRHTYFYTQDSLQEFEDNMKAIVSDFVAMLQRGFFPQHARSFKSPCASCDYNENCPLPPSQRAADLASNLYRTVTWSPIYE